MKKIILLSFAGILLTGCGHSGQLCVPQSALTKAQLSQPTQMQNQTMQNASVPVCVEKN